MITPSNTPCVGAIRNSPILTFGPRSVPSVDLIGDPGAGLQERARKGYIEGARGSGGRGPRKRGEESPGSLERRCRVTPGGGDPRESATESIPPRLPTGSRAGLLAGERGKGGGRAHPVA